jgi:hypothetical protein
MYIGCPHLDNHRFRVVFWRRFRVPYSSFQDLVSFAQDHPLFERWREGNVDALNQPATLLPLHILCALRYIGGGWTFDDLTENAGISERLFSLLNWVWKYLYHKDVIALSTAEEASIHSHKVCTSRILSASAQAMPCTLFLRVPFATESPWLQEFPHFEELHHCIYL